MAIKKKVVKKTVKKLKPKVKSKKKTLVRKSPGKKVAIQKPIGRVTHFFREIKVAVVRFSKPVRRGTMARIKGSTTDFVQKLESMQYEHKALALAPKSKLVGLKVKSRVREGDRIYPA